MHIFARFSQPVNSRQKGETLTMPQHHQQNLFGEPIPQPNPTPQSVKEQQKAIQAKIQALSHCSIGEHTWQPTMTKGERICTVCNIKAYCPMCQPNPPSNARRALCTTHREAEP